MYLKELEIFGFKSFPEKTILKFEPGVTVIVGPNGCGKSNLLDSLKWALGEQSPKSLRGSKMEDIIFNGTECHPALSYSEVSLTFCNEDKYLPIDYKEVAIARKLFRSGESSYYVNKSAVRLKDVQSLFLGTGVGEATYSFIEQGKIELFLSYKPEDKRLIFDEASGIIKYKERKREALRRLEETGENLVRLEDILSEVNRQIKYLDRQVNKAKRYKEIQERLIEIEKKISAVKFSELKAKNDKLSGELSSLSNEESRDEVQLTQFKEEQETLNSSLKDIRDFLSQAGAQVLSLKAHLDSDESKISVYQQNLNDLEQRLKNLDESRISLCARINLLQERAAQERQAVAGIDTRLEQADARLESLLAEKNNLEQEIKESKKKIEDDKIKVLDFETKKVNFTNQLIEIQTNLSSLVKRKARLLLDKTRVEGLLGEKKGLLEKVQQELDVIENALKELQEKKTQLALKQEELDVCEQRLKDDLLAKEKELIELRSCYEFLRDLRTKYDSFSMKKKITVIFDEQPRDINKMVISLKGVEFQRQGNSYKTEIEAKIIALEEEQLEEKIRAAEQSIGSLRGSLSDLEGQKSQLKEASAFESKELAEQESFKRAKAQEKEAVGGDWVRLGEELEIVEGEMKTVLEESDLLENEHKKTQASALSYQEQLAIIHRDLTHCQDTITRDYERLKEIDIDIARGQAKRESMVKEKESLGSKLSVFEEETAGIEKNLENIAKEKDAGSLRIISFQREIEAINVLARQNKDKIEQYLEKKKEWETRQAAVLKDLDKNKENISAVEKRVQEFKSSIYNKRFELQSLQYEKQKLKDYLNQVYNIDIDEGALSFEGDEREYNSLLEEKEKIKKRIQSLGEVNLIAIEEFDELKKREDFLSRQKQDLITSKDNLKQAIQKINRISKDIFLETFNKIQEEFKRNFRFLFAGGKAQLVLLDQDNILESGVEIEVQPPGKKLQNVSLLSGGEKALTAISLIFAIFKVRPSPICVLDEIDAPLDEANVDRFNHLLREFSSLSQFIVITHNKRTMGNADVLYGVTMQEKGVSKVVSVKFSHQKSSDTVSNLI